MIAYIKGRVIFKGSGYVILDVGGIGYKIYLAGDAFGNCPEKGGDIAFYTYLAVRENALDLYGFSRLAERELFEVLIGVSGIGPKSAIAIMSIAPIDTLKKAIATGDPTILTKVSGVGRKTAEKIVVELKDKFTGSHDMSGISRELIDDSDALEALVSLGYLQREAREALRQVTKSDMDVSVKVKEALKLLGSKK